MDDDFDVKAWVLSHDIVPYELPSQEQIVLACQGLHFERVRVGKVPYHPVYRVSARLGELAPKGSRAIKVAIKTMCRNFGFPVKMSEIIAEVSRGRIEAVFGLIAPDAAPVEVEDDGHRVPEHLEFEEAA